MAEHLSLQGSWSVVAMPPWRCKRLGTNLVSLHCRHQDATGGLAYCRHSIVSAPTPYTHPYEVLCWASRYSCHRGTRPRTLLKVSLFAASTASHSSVFVSF